MSILIPKNLCPQCHQTRVFEGYYKMKKNCTACGLIYEREQGYNIGGVIIHYLLAAPLGLLTIVSLIFALEMSFPYALGICVVQIAVTHPFFYKYSALVWMNIHQAIINNGYEGKR
ncbi:MAG: DUF983 domain-containing protein [Xanthomonadaceae bacterium]|nr:DUF983 domain-containing protein [Xanthomonadaceae bacterium]